MLRQDEEIKQEPQVYVTPLNQAETVERPPGNGEGIPSSKRYSPLSFPVIALLMPASVFGVLARLGLVALMDYDGHSVFPLAYAQAVGCLIMGFAIYLRKPTGELYVPSTRLYEKHALCCGL